MQWLWQELQQQRRPTRARVPQSLQRKALQMRNVQQRLQTEWPAYTPCDCRPQGDGTFLWNLQSKRFWSLPSHPAQKETPMSEILFSKILYQRRPTQMRPRAAFFKNFRIISLNLLIFPLNCQFLEEVEGPQKWAWRATCGLRAAGWPTLFYTFFKIFINGGEVREAIKDNLNYI